MKEEDIARRRELAKEQRANGETAMDTLEDDEELEDDEDLLQEDSEGEDAMQVVGTLF